MTLHVYACVLFMLMWWETVGASSCLSYIIVCCVFL